MKLFKSRKLPRAERFYVYDNGEQFGIRELGQFTAIRVSKDQFQNPVRVAGKICALLNAGKLK